MQITIDTDKIKQLASDAKDIFLKAEAEEHLVKLLDIESKVKEAIALAKQEIAEEGQKINPNFSSIKSDRVKISYRSYGQQFYIDQSNLEKLPDDYYSKKTKVEYKPFPAAIKDHLKKNGSLPLGVKENDRKKTISLKLVK